MELHHAPRRKGITMAYCQMIVPKLKNKESVFISGETFPDNYVSILKSLGVEVEVTESYSTQKLERVYDNLFKIEPEIIGFLQKPKKLSGHILTLKAD